MPMHSIAGWKLAQQPNYVTNVDKKYPYSEVPYLGEYRLVKLPASHNIIEHVDYWGEGRIVTNVGISGFSDCYNVNHVFQLVSNGPDRGRKIPNRIPVVNYTNCDTSSYIKDNSVNTVTLMGAPINTSCAKDIARMVNSDLGRVVTYGFEINSQEIKNLTTELKKKSLFHCPKYPLPVELQGLTLFDNDSDVTFLNLTTLKEELYKNVTNGSYDNAVNLTKNMDTERGLEAVSEVVMKLIRANVSNIMTYAYQLWNNGGENIVRNSFPDSFQLIFQQAIVTIVNKEHKQALKFDANVDSSKERLALGDSFDRISKKVSWKIIPVSSDNKITFKLFNIDCNMYITLDVNDDDQLRDRKALGSTNSDEIKHKYYLEPLMKDETLVFRIINCQYNQALMMDENVNSFGERQLLGYKGDAHSDNNALNWIISANTKLWVKEVIEI